MDLRTQLAILRRWSPVLIATVVLTSGLAYLVTGTLQKTFEANATLIVGQSLSAVNPDYSQLLASQRLSATYAVVATTRPLLANVIDQLNLNDAPEELDKRVHAAAVIDSTLLTITVRDTDPATAAAIANALAEQLIKVSSPDLQGHEADNRKFVDEELRATQAQIESTKAQITQLRALPSRTQAQDAELTVLETRLTTLRSTYESMLAVASTAASNLVSMVEPAVAANEPVAPRPLLNALMAGILSLLLVIGIIVVARYLDDSLKDEQDVQDVLGLATLGTIPRFPRQPGREAFYNLVTILFPRSAAAEAYRTLRTNLDFASVEAPIRTLLVTSARPGEGKTVTAANLAVAFAQAGRRVLLVDADLRQPGVHAMFNVVNSRGLSSILRSDGVGWEHAIHATEQENLRLLTTGPPPLNPAELLGSQRMRAVLGQLRDFYDLVIVDSPPLQAVIDSAILSSLVDGTLFVIDSTSTRRQAVRQGREALAKAGAHVLGALLNRLPVQAFPEYGGYGSARAGQEHAPGPVQGV